MSTLRSFLDVLPDVTVAREEIHHNDGYYWDNRTRSPGGWVIQQTVEGSSFYETPGRHFPVPAGTCMIFCHGEDSWYGLRDRSPYRLRWLQLSGGLMNWAASLQQEFGPVLRMEAKGEADRILDGLVADVQQGIWRDRLYLAETATQLLLALYREQVGGRQGVDPVAHGRHLLETQYRSPRNLKEWAAEIGITREHFTREFRARSGETPAAFLRNLRLAHADRLLKAHHVPLADIAASSGFASEQTFHRAYGKAFGISPGKARERHQFGGREEKNNFR